MREVTSGRANQSRIRVGQTQRPAGNKGLHKEAVAKSEHRRRKSGFRELFGAGMLRLAITAEPGELKQDLLA